MEDDFTFPAPGGGRHDDGPAALPATHLGRIQLPGVAAPGAPPLWPFAAPPVGAAATVKEEEAPAPASGRGDAREEEEERELERLVAADEERMDLLLEGAAAATAPASRSGGRVGAQLPERRAEAEEEQKARTAAADAERMDLLWESFNEELLLRRAGSKAAADHPDGVARPGLEDQGSHFCHSPSDAESEETSSSERRYGCAPTMLRASSRAGGAGHFCSSPRRRSRGRGTAAAGGWALLLRLFRRLLAVDKTASRPHSIYVP
ncbi:uncharacterized protein LOC133919080 [Phragmites australis]|uniref:uncharacterized protein LOC133919080 n=1 Tax=Phragmites australis TaxID=29695 RepID=UPI002D76A221|nr:uncharacterized protein LOC133919080 [Phragmites australis]